MRVPQLTRRSLIASAAALSVSALVPRFLHSQAAGYPQPAKNPFPYSGLSGAGYPVTKARRFVRSPLYTWWKNAPSLHHLVC